MSDLRTAAQQALEALELVTDLTNHDDEIYDAIDALKAALAEPVQEPVAWRYQDARGNYRYRGYVQGFDKEYSLLKPVPLYTVPPKRKPLTEEEISNIWDGHIVPIFGKNGINPVVFARAIERAHGIGGQP